MELDYSVQESIYISKELWGKYLDIYFVDSDNNKIPIQLHSKLIPGGFKNKVCIANMNIILNNMQIYTYLTYLIFI